MKTSTSIKSRVVLIVFGITALFLSVTKNEGRAVQALGGEPFTAVAVSNQTNTRVANNFPGADLGAKINAADHDLGRASGTILVRDGGVVSTQVILNPGHSLRFSAGTFRLTTQLQDEGAFLLKSQTSVTGSGWDTVIVEPPSVGWIVFQSYSDIRVNPTHGGTDSNISVSNLQVKGANPAVDGSVRQTVTLGNCHHCSVDHVWFNSTGVIGVAAGGSPMVGNFADTVSIKNNLFTHVGGQCAAVVNGRNVIIDGNTFKDSGRNRSQGVTAIDVEANVAQDIMQNIQITNNTIDSTGSTFLHGNGIVVQNGAMARPCGPVLVRNNKIIGEQLVTGVSGNIAIGIYVASGTTDVTVTDNSISRVGQSGIRLESTTRAYVAHNTLISTGTGGILAFEVINTTDSKILNNVVSVDPRSPLGNSAIKETGTSRNNIYQGNTDGRNPIVPDVRR